MTAKFGATTDHLGILALTAGAGTLDDFLELQSAPKAPLSKSRVNASDENGDVADSSYPGLATIFEVSEVFLVKTGQTLDLSDMLLGMIASGKFVGSIEASTENGAFPKVTVTGMILPAALDPPTLDTFAMPAASILGAKTAQNMGGFTVATGTKLTGSKISASLDTTMENNGIGEQVAFGYSGGAFQVTGDIVGCTAVPAITITSPGLGLTELQAPGADEPQADYMTGSFVCEGTLAARTVPA